MSHSSLTIKDLRELIHAGEAKDPLVFLESVMNGQDPRKLSSIYQLIVDIDGFNDGDIPKSDWCDVVDMVMQNFKYDIVGLADSINASKTLAEYLHPKRKQVEINGEGSGTASAHNSPLTEEEIELFKEKFNEEF